MKTYNEFKKHHMEFYEARMKDAMISVYDAIEKLGHKSTVDNIVKQTKLDKNFVQDAIKYWLTDKKIKKMGSGRQTHWMTESVELDEKPFLKKIKMDKFSRSERKRKKQLHKSAKYYNKNILGIESNEVDESVEEEISTTTTSVGTLTDPIDRGYCPKKKKRRNEIEKFIGSRVFEVSTDEYCHCLTGRNKYERWNKFFSKESDMGHTIKKYSHRNPNSPIIIKDQRTGEMMFLRRRLNDNRLRHNKN